MKARYENYQQIRQKIYISHDRRSLFGVTSRCISHFGSISSEEIWRRVSVSRGDRSSLVEGIKRLWLSRLLREKRRNFIRDRRECVEDIRIKWFTIRAGGRNGHPRCRSLLQRWRGRDIVCTSGQGKWREVRWWRRSGLQLTSRKMGIFFWSQS